MAEKMIVSREEFLTCLQLVSPGLLAKQGVIEQGNAFLFKNDRILTFNDHILCRVKFDLQGLEGAILAAPLLALIDEMEEENITITRLKNKLRVIGKDKGAEFLFQNKITLKYHTVEKPTEWMEISERFGDAVSLVKDCASKKPNEVVLSSIHLHPDYVEATDTYHFARFNLKLPFKSSVLVPEVSLKHIVIIDPRYVSYTPGGNWIHFADKKKRVIYSCRCGEERFVKGTDKAIEEDKGFHLVLPKGLAKALKRGNILSAEQPDTNRVTIDIIKKTKTIRVRSIGLSGKFFEDEDMPKFTGKDTSFVIQTKMLMELAKRHAECFVSDKAVRVEAGSYVYIARTGAVNGEDWKGKKKPAKEDGK